MLVMQNFATTLPPSRTGTNPTLMQPNARPPVLGPAQRVAPRVRWHGGLQAWGGGAVDSHHSCLALLESCWQLLSIGCNWLHVLSARAVQSAARLHAHGSHCFAHLYGLHLGDGQLVAGDAPCL